MHLSDKAPFLPFSTSDEDESMSESEDEAQTPLASPPASMSKSNQTASQVTSLSCQSSLPKPLISQDIKASQSSLSTQG